MYDRQELIGLIMAMCIDFDAAYLLKKKRRSKLKNELFIKLINYFYYNLQFFEAAEPLDGPVV